MGAAQQRGMAVVRRRWRDPYSSIRIYVGGFRRYLTAELEEDRQDGLAMMLSCVPHMTTEELDAVHDARPIL